MVAVDKLLQLYEHKILIYFAAKQDAVHPMIALIYFPKTYILYLLAAFSNPY